MEEVERTLTSWKEIAVYLNRTVRTCQRLEATMNLPVHRLDGSPKAHVFAYPAELNVWLAELTHEREKKQKRRRLLYFSAAATVVVAGAAILIILLGGLKRAPEATPASNEKSVAVLVRNLISTPGSEHLPEGIADAVRDALWQVRGLRVPGRASSEAVGVSKLAYPDIGKRMNVSNILELTVQIAGENLRVRAQLVNVQDGLILWSETYDRLMRMKEIFEIQDQLSKSIADELQVSLLSSREAAESKLPTQDFEAYNLYLKGRYLVSRPRPEGPGEALRLFEKALERDPNFALAYVGIARAYMYMQVLFLKPATEVCPKAAAALKTALTLEPALAEAHALLGWVQFLYHFDWDAADRSFRRALELKPGDALTRGMYAYSLMPKKRLAEARKEIKRALAMDPLIPTLYGYSMWIHLYSGMNEEVLEEFKKFQQIEPNLGAPIFAAGLAYLNLGRLKESMDMFQKAYNIPHRTGWPEAGLAVAYLKSGDRTAAEALYRELVEERENTGAGSPVHLAWVAALLGDLDGASRWLEIAVKEHDPSVVALPVSVEASAPEVARDPRLLKILDRLHLPH